MHTTGGPLRPTSTRPASCPHAFGANHRARHSPPRAQHRGPCPGQPPHWHSVVTWARMGVIMGPPAAEASATRRSCSRRPLARLSTAASNRPCGTQWCPTPTCKHRRHRPRRRWDRRDTQGTQVLRVLRVGALADGRDLAEVAGQRNRWSLWRAGRASLPARRVRAYTKGPCNTTLKLRHFSARREESESTVFETKNSL